MLGRPGEARKLRECQLLPPVSKDPKRGLNRWATFSRRARRVAVLVGRTLRGTRTRLLSVGLAAWKARARAVGDRRRAGTSLLHSACGGHAKRAEVRRVGRAFRKWWQSWRHRQQMDLSLSLLRNRLSAAVSAGARLAAKTAPSGHATP